MGMMPGAPGAGGQPAMPGMPGQGPDWKKLFDTEKENIEFIKHKFIIERFEDKLIEKMKKNLHK